MIYGLFIGFVGVLLFYVGGIVLERNIEDIALASFAFGAGIFAFVLSLAVLIDVLGGN